MNKICITKNSHEKACFKCLHYKYDCDYDELRCHAIPNEDGEVEWEPKKEKPKKSYITFSSSCG